MESPTEVIALTAAVMPLELYIDREQCADTVIRDCGRRRLLGSGLVRWRWLRWRGAVGGFFLFFWAGVAFGDQFAEIFRDLARLRLGRSAVASGLSGRVSLAGHLNGIACK